MYFKILLLVFVLTVSIAGQTYITVLDSVNSSPIENVVVFNGYYLETTNNRGNFSTKRFKIGDKLILNHLAYKTKHVILSKKLDKIFLSPRELSSEEVIVKGSKVKTTDNKLNINLQKINTTYLTPTKILRDNSNLLIKEYGSFESPVTFSSRGMSSENTMVLFNEAKVNDISSGIFDLSKVSSNSIDEINYFTTTDGYNGSYAGGILKLESNNLKNQKSYNLSFKTDTYGLKSFLSGIKDYSNKFAWNLNFERTYSSNHYNYYFHNKKQKRNNANFSKSFLGGSLSYKQNNYLISIYSHISKFSNGIPGYVLTNNDNSSLSTSFTQTFLSIINFDINLSKKINYHLTSSYNNQLQVFIDPKADLFYTDKRRESRLNDFNLSNRFSFNNDNIDIKSSYNFNYTDINGVNYIKLLKRPSTNYRYFHQLNLNINYKPDFISKNLNIASNLSYENIEEDLGYKLNTKTFSYLISAYYKINRNALRIKYFRTERSPNLIERYYSNIFGPNELFPEKYFGYDVSLILDQFLNLPLYATISYFNINGTDKIIWIPSRMGLQVPKNFAKINSKGVEILSKVKLSKWLNINTNYTFNDSRNKKSWGYGDNSYNKTLIYSPKHRFSISALINYKNYSLEITDNYSSKSYFQPDNAYTSKLNSFNIINVSFTYTFKLFNKNNSFNISVFNLTDKEYYIIQSYPLPSRNYLFTYKLELI